MNFFRTIKNNSSLVVLIVANLVPIVQVVYFDLDVFPLIFLFWIETAIIGILNIPKLVIFHGRNAIGMVPFFIFHFGSFMCAHLFFLVVLFLMKITPGETYSGPLNDFGTLVTTLVSYVKILWISVLTLALSHVYSFAVNYVGSKEYQIKDPNKDPMGLPYSRVVVMHIVIMLGGFLVLLIGEKGISIVALVILKTLFDIRGHIREHKKNVGEVKDGQVCTQG